MTEMNPQFDAQPATEAQAAPSKSKAGTAPRKAAGSSKTASAQQSSRKRKPRVEVALTHKTVSKTVTLTQPVADLLANYAQFLSEFHGQEVTEEAVIQGAVATIAKDKEYDEWRQRRRKIPSL